MDTNIIKELLNDDAVVSLDLLLSTGDVINISDHINLDDEKSLLINKEENNIINLNHVVKVTIKRKVDLDKSFDSLDKLNF